MNRSVGPVCAALVTVTLAVSSPHAGVFTIEQRVTAQESIERVYAAHRTESHRGLAKTAPPALLREKVRTYLEQTVALESYWSGEDVSFARMIEGKAAILCFWGLG